MEAVKLPLHLLSLSYVLITAYKADHIGFLWLRGKIDKVNGPTVQRYHRHMWIGLCLMLVTGFVLFYPLRNYLLARPQFYIKMSFVAILILNGFAIGKLEHIAVNHPFKELSKEERTPIYISAALSTIGWLGAITMAFFLLP